MCRLLIPKLIESNGHITNIASGAGLLAPGGMAAYASSKFALRGMTQTWQAELRKFNVRVTQVNPSEVTTAFANEERVEREEVSNKLNSQEVADTIVSTLKMRDKGFIPEVTIWATNPF